jgi:chromosome segregation ATPase
LLNGSDVRDSQSTNESGAENTFKELLHMCRGDLDEII